MKEFIYPDWRKLAVFFLVILFSVSLWTYVLVNSLPIMIIGTNEFRILFCNMQLTAIDCSLNSTEIYRREASLNQTLDNLNEKYNKFAKINSYFDIAKIIIPSGALSCVLDKDVVSLLNQSPRTQNLNILEIQPACYTNSLLNLAINLIIIYLVICSLFWFYDKKK